MDEAVYIAFMQMPHLIMSRQKLEWRKGAVEGPNSVAKNRCCDKRIVFWLESGRRIFEFQGQLEIIYECVTLTTINSNIVNAKVQSH